MECRNNNPVCQKITKFQAAPLLLDFLKMFTSLKGRAKGREKVIPPADSPLQCWQQPDWIRLKPEAKGTKGSTTSVKESQVPEPSFVVCLGVIWLEAEAGFDCRQFDIGCRVPKQWFNTLCHNTHLCFQFIILILKLHSSSRSVKKHAFQRVVKELEPWTVKEATVNTEYSKLSF